jgi:hypothetical protein
LDLLRVFRLKIPSQKEMILKRRHGQPCCLVLHFISPSALMKCSTPQGLRPYGAPRRSYSSRLYALTPWRALRALGRTLQSGQGLKEFTGNDFRPLPVRQRRQRYRLEVRLHKRERTTDKGLESHGFRQQLVVTVRAHGRSPPGKRCLCRRILLSRYNLQPS